MQTLIAEDFAIGNKVVYPAHGIGTIISETFQKIGDMNLMLLVIEFSKDKMTIRLPKEKAIETGLRHLSNKKQLLDAYETLKGKARISKGMWSRRQQEYETKINSGNIISLAEVVRDLFKDPVDPNRSYSEKLIYEAAFSRLAAEIAIVEELDEKNAETKLLNLLHTKKAA